MTQDERDESTEKPLRVPGAKLGRDSWDDLGPLLLLVMIVVCVFVAWLTWGTVGMPNRDYP
jgi:hypothetical protein